MVLKNEAGSSPATADPVEAPILLTTQVSWADTSPITQIKLDFGSEPLSFLALFVSPKADFDRVVEQASQLFPDIDVAACTTAGEIGDFGYEEGTIIAVGFPAAGFATSSILIENIRELDALPLIDSITLARVKLQNQHPDLVSSFAFLLVDGLSLSEDALSATISPALRDMPMFGGSAGDGTDFNRTRVALGGQVHDTAAVLTLVRSRYKTEVFSLDHLVPSENQMVVTEADPGKRIVKSINAEPAGREYARIVGKDPEQLNQFTFAAHPVVVRIGGAHHVRAIQRINEEGELVFFSAIDEGMVLTLAAPQNMVEHLQNKMADLSANAKPAHILGCDCILRKIEAEQRQMTRDLSDVMSSYNVTGFSTYGEQIGPLHVNHTMSGVAIYAPED
jgi:hypothetical protein